MILSLGLQPVGWGTIYLHQCFARLNFINALLKLGCLSSRNRQHRKDRTAVVDSLIWSDRVL